jgi:hypothetical protein
VNATGEVRRSGEGTWLVAMATIDVNLGTDADTEPVEQTGSIIDHLQESISGASSSGLRTFIDTLGALLRVLVGGLITGQVQMRPVMSLIGSRL